MLIEKRNINDLIHATYNPRKDLQPGDEEYQKIKRSIEKFGYVDPVIINKDNTIIGGHQRAKVLQDLGYTEIDVVIVDLSKDEEKALNIALNKITGEWDFDKLNALMDELQAVDFDTMLTGFDFTELEEMRNNIMSEREVKEDDFNAETEAKAITEPITQRGDIWLLGNHRLMCGDSTNENNVSVLMNNEKAHLIITDPPYNVDYVGKTKEKLTIKNDKMTDNEFYHFLLTAYKNMFSSSTDGAGIYVFHADGEGLNFRKALIDSGFKLAQCCIWFKNSMVMGRQDYHWQHEPILYGWKPTGAHNWYGDRKQTTIWNFDRPNRNSDHPTMKPLDLIGYPIRNSSKINDIILDLFGGSGSTLLATEQLNRICYMMELDEVYCDVIVKRYINHIGNDKDVYLIRNGEKIPYSKAV